MVIRIVCFEAIRILSNPTICGVNLIVRLTIKLDILSLLEGFKVSEPMGVDPVASDLTFCFTSNTVVLETLARAESPVDILGRLIFNVVIFVELTWVGVKEGTEISREAIVYRVNISDDEVIDGFVEELTSLASECLKIDIGANSHAIPKTSFGT